MFNFLQLACLGTLSCLFLLTSFLGRDTHITSPFGATQSLGRGPGAGAPSGLGVAGLGWSMGPDDIPFPKSTSDRLKLEF